VRPIGFYNLLVRPIVFYSTSNSIKTRLIKWKQGPGIQSWISKLYCCCCCLFINSTLFSDFQELLNGSGLTPVAGLFLMRLDFEQIFKTKGIFKIKDRFQAMLE